MSHNLRPEDFATLEYRIPRYGERLPIVSRSVRKILLRLHADSIKNKKQKEIEDVKEI
jgi:hypothetical protein